MTRIGFVSCMFAGMTAFAMDAQPDGREWEDMTRMSEGREATRAAFAPFSTEKAALEILPWKSDRQVSLDSDTAWKFKWSKDPASRPAGFEKPAYDVSHWETIKVPCSWQAYGANGKGGWGKPLYTNVTFPFKVAPPRVTDEPPRDYTNFEARDPVGSYRRDFTVPADWNGDRVFLKFDGVDSFYYLWVNGRYVGFTKDSRCAAEFDVTDFVKPGKNTVALEVYRYSDGSYFEDQDMFRLSGIFRSCWLVRRPTVRIRDFFARTRPAEDGRYDGDWILDVESELADGGARGARALPGGEKVEVKLYELNGTPVAMADAGIAGRTAFRVAKPKTWSPEMPNCYKLVLTLKHGNRIAECVSTLIGFRTSAIRNGRYELNGKKVKLHGADRHETDPMYGHYVSHERQEEDIRLLKRANCNMVRNSHYPQDDYWYYLCDLNGICLMDEANVETHGYHMNGKSGGSEPMFRDAMVWRNLNMVERNKNHPSVIFWSHGNECGSGDNFKACDEAVHARDRSRPTHYEGDWANSDVDSNMYPSVDGVWGRARWKDAPRPYYICEYAHNMMNAMGNLKDYQDAIESSDVVIGGTIWDWVDQGLYKNEEVRIRNEESGAGKSDNGAVKSRMIIGFGGDWGDRPTDGQFVMNGCILSDRQLEPGYWEIKHVFQPVGVTLDAGGKSVTVWNKQFFRSLGVYDAICRIVQNGKAGERTKIDLDGVGPRERKTLPLPAAALAAVKPGVSVSVRYEFACRERDGMLEKGYVIADDQVDLPNEARAVPFVAPAGKVASARNGEKLEVTAGKVKAVFDVRTGELVSYKVDGRERLLKPMTLDAFRAPSSNEVGLGERSAELGFRNFKAKAVSFSNVVKNGGVASFDVEIEYVGAVRERIDAYGRSHTKLIASEKPVSRWAPVFRAMQHWCAYADGTLTCQSEIRPFGPRTELLRIGYHFTLPLDCGKVGWFGRGPFENYRDRKSGAFRGLWKTDLRDFVMPYARSEDANNWEDTDAVTLYGDNGAIGFATLGAPFACEALPYDSDELIRYVHPAELPKPAKVEFGIFAETRGLGGNSCGPKPLKRDIIDTDRNYRLDFAIMPHAARTALSVPPVKLASSDRERIPHFDGMKLKSVTSEQGGWEKAANAIDGDFGTFWHTAYNGKEVPHPHEIVFSLGRDATLSGLLAVPRQDGMPNGRVARYRVETSLDMKNWQTVAEGKLPDTDMPGEIAFKAKTRVNYIRFTCLESHRGDRWTSMAEFIPIEDNVR